eukprot:257700_1
MCICICFFFIIMPYTVNLWMAAKIRSTNVILKNDAAITYFTNNIASFVLLVSLSGSCFTALQVVSSGIFGIDHLNSGLTRYEVRQLSKLRIIGTVCLENAPQLAIQIIYSAILGTISDSTYLSFFASSISVISAILSYLIEKDTSGNTAVQYSIFITKRDFKENVSHLSESDRNALIRNKGRTLALARSIAEIFATPSQNIEFSKHSLLTTDGLIIHAVHIISISAKRQLLAHDRYKHDKGAIISSEYIAFKLYQMFRFEVISVFQKHFETNELTYQFRHHYDHDGNATQVQSDGDTKRPANTATVEQDVIDKVDMGELNDALEMVPPVLPVYIGNVDGPGDVDHGLPLSMSTIGQPADENDMDDTAHTSTSAVLTDIDIEELDVLLDMIPDEQLQPTEVKDDTAPT